MPGAKKTRWLGGAIRWGTRGPSFVIDRWIDGVHWHLTTKCRTERAALRELEKFEAAPADYRRARSRRNAGLEVTPELLADYLADMARRKLDPPYIRQAKTSLGQVMVALAGRDLARTTFVELRELVDACGPADKPAARAARRKHLKGFARWLRVERGLLTRANDPTLDLSIDAQPPEKNRRRKAMSLDLVSRAVAAMDEDVRDVAIVLAATGHHIREIQRFHAGTGDLHPPAEWQKGVLANLSVLHKSGKTHNVAITDQAVLDAVLRLRARKECPTRGRITKHDKRVSAVIGEKFSMGWLRHSVATWLAELHVSEADIAAHLGHSGTDMVRQVYVDLGQSAHAVPVPKLRLVP